MLYLGVQYGPCKDKKFELKREYHDLILSKHYTPEQYPKYDSYDAIEVSKVADIPCDFAGVMGVPIMFLE